MTEGICDFAVLPSQWELLEVASSITFAIRVGWPPDRCDNILRRLTASLSCSALA